MLGCALLGCALLGCACARRLAATPRGCNHPRMTQSIHWNGLLVVGIGAAVGAWLRWGLGQAFNAVLPELPLGTLAANILGGYLIGLALAWFTLNPGLAPEVRLLVATGFLGGLTTFSSYSGEAYILLARQQYGWAAAHIGLHVLGSLAATALGFATVRLLRG
jgi:CrcB protein